MRNVYIFGAHSRAQTLGVYLKKLNTDLRIAAYLVNNEEPNAKEIEGVPVLQIKEDSILDTSLPVFIGTRGIYHNEIQALLKSLGIQEIIPVTPNLDMQLRNECLNKYYTDLGRELTKMENIQSCSDLFMKSACSKQSMKSSCIYVVKSIHDKPLQEDNILLPYQKEIQVGAALTDIRISDVTDDKGYNISDKNKQFCELTALYWIWKNAKEDIVGLEHYRRHFILPEDWENKMVSENIDVILPTPLYVMPSLAQNYRDRHVAADWEFMMNQLQQLYPEDYIAAEEFFDTNWYSPCNMFIMKKEVLNEFCSWLFPILLVCAEHIGEKEDTYQNRYPGFLSERLMTFYFEKHREQYRVAFADKNFLQ